MSRKLVRSTVMPSAGASALSARTRRGSRSDRGECKSLLSKVLNAGQATSAKKRRTSRQPWVYGRANFSRRARVLVDACRAI